MMKFLVPLLLFSNFAFAENFKITGTLVTFENKNGLLVSGCEHSCQALKTIEKYKKIELKKARGHEQFAGSVGSDVCRLIYKARSLIGLAMNNDQRAFCVFPDNSLIELNSLTDYLEAKKIVKE